MADDGVRKELYSYKSYSSLVLKSSNRGRRNPDEGTGEALSLAGRTLAPMGDRAIRAAPPGLEKSRKKRAAESDSAAGASKRARTAQGDLAVDAVRVGYQPQSRPTRAAYESLLAWLSGVFGAVSPDILHDAANELLVVFKTDNADSDAVRRTAAEELLGSPVSDSDLHKLISLARAMTDWVPPEELKPTASGFGDAAAAAAADTGIGVVIEDEDDGPVDPTKGPKAEDMYDSEMVELENDDDDDNDDNANAAAGLGDDGNGAQARAGTSAGFKPAPDGLVKGSSAAAAAGGDGSLDPSSIDAHWLQRFLSSAYADAQEAQTKAEEVLEILAAPDTRLVENKLVLLLGFDKFNLVKTLMPNRSVIVWATKAARASTDQARDELRAAAAASADPNAANILATLWDEPAAHTDSPQPMDATPTTSSKTKGKGKGKGKATKTAAEYAAKRGGRLVASSSGLASAPPPPGTAGSSTPAPTKLLDLETLSFASGSHTMTNKTCELPRAIRKQYAGYEEVRVPAMRATAFAKEERLIPIEELPSWSHAAFPGMKSLNRVQSRLCNAALERSENLLVCAPTGAGKTNVAMLTIMHELGKVMRPDGSFDLDAFKIVYVAPMKSLVQEMVSNFGNRLSSYGVQVKELTGDSQLTKTQIAATQIIVTTPEKWDIVTRKAGDRTYTQLVRLVIIDEVHLLHDSRGPVLEALVARTRRQVETLREPVRLVGLSATLPNYEDVATFLKVNPSTGLFYFDGSYRPCPLEQTYVGITERKATKRLALMNTLTYEKVLAQAGQNQTLVFVHSRKDTVKTAKMLRDTALANETIGAFLSETGDSRKILASVLESEPIASADLKELLPYGFGCHHAGMTRADRMLVEDLFAAGHMQVLVSTATLAWGVNLPAHTVIIKGTQVYSAEKGRWIELSPLDVMQMLGRAGRPAFDSKGEGIVITSHSELQFYLSLLNQQLPIESQLFANLPDLLNAEVVAGAVGSVEEGVRWLGYTYLFVRLLRSPHIYGVPADEAEADRLLAGHRANVIHSAASQLDAHGLVRYDRRTGTIVATDLGKVASHYYITHGSMAVYNDHMKATMSDIEILRLFSLSSEFKFVSVREDEKVELGKLLENVPIPVKETLEEPSAKINVLLQAYISRLSLDGFALASDMVYVTQSAGRLLRALFEIALKRGWAAVAWRLLAFGKMVEKRMWGSQTQLRQFRGLPYEVLRSIEKKDIPWDRWTDFTLAQVSELMDNASKTARKVYERIHWFPKINVAATVQPVTRGMLQVELTLTPDFQWKEEVHGGAEAFWITIEDVDAENILHTENWILKASRAEHESFLSFFVPLTTPLPPQYFVRVTSDRWLGSETVLPISFRKLILPAPAPPPTDLLDLQPLPIKRAPGLHPGLAKLYSASTGWTHFNAIQTQVWSSLVESNDGFFLAAPSGGGKTVCAEAAIGRALATAVEAGREVRVVYVHVVPEAAKALAAEWKNTIGASLEVPVSLLVGDSVTDNKLVDAGGIIVASAVAWDAVSRRWKTRQALQEVDLFIADGLHMLGSGDGPVMEVVVSRMRYLSTQLGGRTRVLGLAGCVSNARELGEWIGASPAAQFSFAPDARPVPAEVHIQGFDIANWNTRVMAMRKPTYLAAVRHGHGGTVPVIVYVPSRKQAWQMALELAIYAGSNNSWSSAPDELKAVMESKVLSDGAFEYTLPAGVAFMHEAMTDKEKATVGRLYELGAVKVLVISAGEAWTAPHRAGVVVVAGTQRYDGREDRYVDYSLAEVTHMLGRAGRPGLDESGVCVLLTHSARKAFLSKFLFEAPPVESQLDIVFPETLTAEVVTGTVENKQGAVDYLTWTYFYRRLTANPNYYNLSGVSHAHVSDHLSELVEATIFDLANSGCIGVDEDELGLSALNLGMIAAYYYVQHTSIEVFATSLGPKTKLRGLLEIVTSAAEFWDLPIRHGEDNVIQRLARHVALKIERPSWTEPRVKANVLLQTHFGRTKLDNPDLVADRRHVVGSVVQLLRAMVDVISSSGWLRPALACMELSQMVVQGLWTKDSVLKQLPHVDSATVDRAIAANMNSVYDLMEAEDEDRDKVLALAPAQLAEVAEVANAYPSVDVEHEVVAKSSNLTAGGNVTVRVTLTRDLDEDEEVESVVPAPRFPKQHEEGWWVVVGSEEDNALLAIKRVAVGRKKKVKLEWALPEDAAGTTKSYKVYLMSDCWMGCDQEYEVNVDVA